MTLLSSLQSRIFLTSALVAVLSIGTALYLVSVRVTREFEDSLQREIRSTGTLVEQLRTTRAQTFAMMARLIADTPKLKAAVDTNDPATVQDNASDYQSQLKSNLLLVTNETGQVLATVGATSRTALVVASQPAVREAIAGKESLSLIPQPGGLLHLISVPITLGLSHPDILGALSVGFLLDDEFANQLKEMTGSEIAFGMDGQILASTLPRDERSVLATALRRDEGPGQLLIGAEEYVTLALPLTGTGVTPPPAPDSGPVALILRSRTDQLRFLREIRTGLTITAVLVVCVATLLSFAVARTITRPLAAITGVMREVAATGDLTRKILLKPGRRWDDEDAQLLATTFNTLTDSVARAQREVSQKERLSSLGRLSTVIAHEVRNPLMIIKAALHTLRGPDLDLAAVREAAKDIDEEVVRLNRIVNDVLDFARPIHFELSPTDINALCRESAAAAQATPGAHVDVRVDPSLPALMLDSERLRMALINLLVNARDAGGPDRTVSISTERDRQFIVVTVEDQGRGIAPGDLQHVFDPYFTTKRGGTGLGLPISKNIVEGLGGSIEIQTPPAGGTRIRLTFPMESAPDVSPGAAATVADGSPASMPRERHAV